MLPQLQAEFLRADETEVNWRGRRPGGNVHELRVSARTCAWACMIAHEPNFMLALFARLCQAHIYPCVLTGPWHAQRFRSVVNNELGIYPP